MDRDILKTHDDIQFVRVSLLSARSLDKAEEAIREKKPYFKACMDEIKVRFGLSLWHNVDKESYFWESRDGQNSIQYSNRADALKALLDETIQWLPK